MAKSLTDLRALFDAARANKVEVNEGLGVRDAGKRCQCGHLDFDHALDSHWAEGRGHCQSCPSQKCSAFIPVDLPFQPNPCSSCGHGRRSHLDTGCVLIGFDEASGTTSKCWCLEFK